MNQYNNVNVILSNSQLNKLKLAIKNETAVTLTLLSDMIVNLMMGLFSKFQSFV